MDQFTDNERAAMARRLLADPMLQAAFKQVYQDAVFVMCNSPEVERRTEAHFMVQALESIKEALKEHLTQSTISHLNQRA